MTDFGKTLFGGSRFIFWSLAPAILIFLFTMPFLVPKWSVGIVAMLVGFWIIGVCLILGMMNPARFGWAFRIVSGMIVLLYVAYALTELGQNDWTLKRPRSRGEANPVNALVGLVVIGSPALMYTLLGRFTFRKHENESLADEETDEDNNEGDEPYTAKRGEAHRHR